MNATDTSAADRPVIYQLFVRLFGNTNETRKAGGTLAENGCGRLGDVDDRALAGLKELGVTHVWLTGVLEQASRTAHPEAGIEADDPDICKGLAGSPYAIKDYYDVCPDYAVDPAKRLDEFQALVQRCHAAGLKALIDFVPNHVSRAYRSDIRPDRTFGAGDRRGVFFDRNNHFFYLQLGGPDLRLPRSRQAGADGAFAPERGAGRVTGNNCASWTPGTDDWYETVKLNYGWNFADGRPGPNAFAGAEKDPPRTWTAMDDILAYWQGLGVDGFRCDMAHMVPMPFWRFALGRARARNPAVFFFAEAYDNDPAKLTDGNVQEALLQAGFNAVYDDPAYDTLQGIYEGGKWANDLDALIDDSSRFRRSLRYAENHDEIRLAARGRWGGAGMDVGRPVSAILLLLGPGPVMLYNGQEVGEPADGAEGYGGDDGRTTIFDYWCMPEFAKWVNQGRFDGGRLSPQQRALREFYGRLCAAARRPVFAAGTTIPLNRHNVENPAGGRLGRETASGHWLYAFLRADAESRSVALVAANLHPKETLKEIVLRIPASVRPGPAAWWKSTPRDLLGGTTACAIVETGDGLEVRIASLPPLTPLALEWEAGR